MRRGLDSMKLRTFLIVFLSFAAILTCSAVIIYLQSEAMKSFNLEVLENKLYAENASILSWAM
jgi:hypothetical protein